VIEDRAEAEYKRVLALPLNKIESETEEEII
jgi:hypothetical protein